MNENTKNELTKKAAKLVGLEVHPIHEVKIEGTLEHKGKEIKTLGRRRVANRDFGKGLVIEAEGGTVWVRWTYSDGMTGLGQHHADHVIAA